MSQSDTDVSKFTAPLPEGDSLRALLQPGINALRCHWPQFLFFQALSLGMVVSYFNFERVEFYCQKLAVLKQETGLWFAAVSLVIAGFILPEIAKYLLRSGNRVKPRHYLSTMLFFAGGGILIDLQYHLFSFLFGAGADAQTIIKKVIADQFIATPLYGVPYWIIVFAWRENGYRFRPTFKMISRRWYRHSVMPLLLPAWCYWIPATMMIFSMPGPLQFSLFAFSMAAWSLILLFIASKEKPVVNNI